MNHAREVAKLAANLRGRAIGPNDTDYEQARKVNNASIDRRPRLIVRPADTADVVAALRFARDQDMLLSVRGGAHGVPGFATNDDGLVIDLSSLKGIRVDPENKRLVAQGGCTWGDVDQATHAFGLATPGGVISTTGIGGLTLGGGIGNLTRKCGLSCDNLASAQVVLADGRTVVANGSENADLFWALRGGGGNFGVVTSFEFRLHEVSTVYAGPLLWSIDRAAEVLKFANSFIVEAPEDLNVILAFLQVPPAAPFPVALHGVNVLGAVVCYAGPQARAEKAVKPLRDMAPMFDGLGLMPFPALQRAFDPTAPPGLHNYWKADFVRELSDEVIEQHVRFAPRVPNMFSGAHIFTVSGAAQRPGIEETAWSHRDAAFTHVVFAMDADPAMIADEREWVREYWSALHPHSAGGAYVNFLMDEGDDRIAASYGPNYERLVEVKTKYDPDNLFRMNQNIKPRS